MLHDDLREQAWLLARIDPHRPRQANLRRAVSSGYYALFHLLVDAATRASLGHGTGLTASRNVLARGFEHAQMARACVSFAGGTLPRVVAAGLAGASPPADLSRVAERFVLLQEQRHAADYDLAARFSRASVLSLLGEVDRAFASWSRVRVDPSARLFLALLVTFDSIRRR